MPANPTPAEGVVTPEMVRTWKTKAARRYMTSSLSEYCPEEFLLLADAYLELAARPAAPTQSAAQTGEVERWRPLLVAVRDFIISLPDDVCEERAEHLDRITAATYALSQPEAGR